MLIRSNLKSTIQEIRVPTMARLDSEKFGQVYQIDLPRSGTWRSGETDPIADIATLLTIFTACQFPHDLIKEAS